jgi:peptide deformylase
MTVLSLAVLSLGRQSAVQFSRNCTTEEKHMNVRSVENVQEELLRTPCEKVETADEARAIILELEKAYQTQPDCLGLAAPQIGINKAVCIIRDRKHGTAINLINPEITHTEEEFTSEYEGCMSFPKRRFKTPRYRLVGIETDAIWMAEEDGAPLPLDNPMEGAGGRLVRNKAVYGMHQGISSHGGPIVVAVQHEIDHLNGICLPWRDDTEEVPYISEGIFTTEKKVGRNEKCPCGSGKKYKKCCGK